MAISPSEREQEEAIVSEVNRPRTIPNKTMLKNHLIEGGERVMDKQHFDKDQTAKQIVTDYITEHLDKSDIPPFFDVYIVWKAKVLQNWKYLLSSTLYDGMYYELTYNGDKAEWYLDAYKKFENRVVKE